MIVKLLTYWILDEKINSFKNPEFYKYRIWEARELKNDKYILYSIASFKNNHPINKSVEFTEIEILINFNQVVITEIPKNWPIITDLINNLNSF
jgi:hypothetical protein